MRIYKILATAFTAVFLGTGIGLTAVDMVSEKGDGDLIVRSHFVGITKISADAKAANLKEFGAMPETTELKDKTLAKLATAPYRFLLSRIPKENTNDFAALIRPMLDDILNNESYLEMRDTTNPVPELMLAVRVDNGRAQLWQSFLTTILESWTGIGITPTNGDGFTGWELKKHHDPNVIRFFHAGDWVIFGWGWNDISLQSGFLQRIKSTGLPYQSPSTNWLDLMIDAPTILAHHKIVLPFPTPPEVPKLHLKLEGRTEFVRPQLIMEFAKPLDIKLDPWKLPLQELHDQFVSFTIARGIAPWFGSLPEVANLHLNPVPNQLSIWSLRRVPFETCVAFPVVGASNVMKRVGPQLANELNANLSANILRTKAVWTNNTLRITDIPFLSPYLEAKTEKNGEFVIGGLFPDPHLTNSEPLPADLLHEINTKGQLVYGDWEINETRVEQWRVLFQTYLMSHGKMLPDGSMPAEKWITAAKSKLGNCGTEINLTAPNELTLIRNSPVGLTGVEMTLVAYWLDGVDFPFSPRYVFTPAPSNKKPAH